MTSPSQVVRRAGDDPCQCCEEWLPGARDAREALLCVRFDLPQVWLDGSPRQRLWALYLWRQGELSIAVGEVEPAIERDIPGIIFDTWVRRQRLFVAISGEALPLGTRVIDKPWGREVWYTGVEKRAVCSFANDSGEVPQPWMLAALPGAEYTRAGEATLLLKILAPSAEAVAGDLYFELHSEKEEVYVVTHVEPAAWKDGVGYIRYGFDPGRVAQWGGEQKFRRAYLAAVEAYRGVREAIDALPGNVPVPEGLRNREREMRTAMDAFTSLKPVRRGDVIHVPRLLPHALQHGVRVVELQTPVYERKILSFAQRVLTQPHWDTAEAVAEMELFPPDEAPATVLRDAEGGMAQRIAEADDFELRRLQIAPGGRLSLTVEGPYALLMVLEGAIEISGRRQGEGQAAWLPAAWQAELVLAQAAPAVDLLLAIPRS